MATGMSSQEMDAMFDSMDENMLQTTIWEAIQRLQSIDIGVFSREPKFAKGEHILVGDKEYIVNDYCEIAEHFVYQLAFQENPVFYIIAIEGIIKK